jgi:hypothetical protein
MARPTAEQLREPADRHGTAAARRPMLHRLPLASAWLLLALEAAAVIALLLPGIQRPFNVDEGWRAFYISRGRDFWSTLRHIDAPLPAGWVLLVKADQLVFGNVESRLRALSLVCLPLLAVATYALARRFAGRIVALLTGALVILDSGVLTYATQAKQYVFEALCTVLLLITWLAALRGERPLRARLGLALLCGVWTVFATPVLFVLLPLVALELLAAVRAAGWAKLPRRLGVPVAALVPGLAHMAVFVRHESANVGTSVHLVQYWVGDFPPAGGPGPWFAWLGRQLHGLVPGIVTVGEPGPPDFPLPHTPELNTASGGLVVAALAVAVLAAALAARRNPDVGKLHVAMFGALAIELVLSGFHAWPFGWSRANVFLVPLVYVQAAAAAGWLLRPGAAWPAVRLLLVGVLLAGGGVAALQARNQIRALRLDLGPKAPQGQMRTVVEQVRHRSGPHDVAVVVIQGPLFSYYLRDYQGYPADVASRPPIRADRIEFVGRFDDPTVPPFVDAHRGAQRVVLWEPVGVSGRLHGAQVAALESLGYRAVWSRNYSGTGLLTVLQR